MFITYGALCKSNLKLKSCEFSFIHDVFRSCPAVVAFCVDQGNDTVVLCGEFRNNWTTETDDMDQFFSVEFEIKMIFGRKSYIA